MLSCNNIDESVPASYWRGVGLDSEPHRVILKTLKMVKTGNSNSIGNVLAPKQAQVIAMQGFCFQTKVV